MNCKEFETLIGDLTRQNMMPAASRDAALAHSDACGHCAARLADERALAVGLKALAASDEPRTAPAYVEAVLLAAFRRQADPPVAHPLPLAPIHIARHWPGWAWAAAAAVLLTAGIFLYNSTQRKPSSGDIVVTAPSPTPRVSVTPAAKPEERIVEAPPQLQRRAVQVAADRGRKRPQAAPFLIREEMTLYADEGETTTEFLSLDYGQNPSPMESGQLIRVQMPHSALAKFGLPVNVERAESPVKADLLVGEDGLARAIRFVR